jgi:hypothetical protein
MERHNRLVSHISAVGNLFRYGPRGAKALYFFTTSGSGLLPFLLPSLVAGCSHVLFRYDLIKLSETESGGKTITL